MKTLREQLGKPVLFHRVGWHGKDGKPSIPGYDSRDPDVITHQADAMQAWGGEGAGVLALSFGLASEFIAESVMLMAQQCNARGMPFGLCMDPWTCSKNGVKMTDPAECNDAMIAALEDPAIQSILQMDCYLKGKPVLDFETGADPDVVRAAIPGIAYWMKDADYDWIKIPVKPNKTKLPAAYLQFDDGLTSEDRNTSCWNPDEPARIVQAMGGATFWNCDVSAAEDFVQIETWDDYREGTAVEPLAAMLVGRI
jgi:hypothetical protein